MGLQRFRIAAFTLALAYASAFASPTPVPARSVATARAPDFDATLRRIDKLRTSRAKEASALLDSLEPHVADATAAQRRYLRLLRDHRNVLRGEYGSAIGDAVALYDQAPETVIKYRAALLVANICALNRDYAMGLRYLDRAIALQSKVADPELRRVGDVVAGTVYNEYEQFEPALESANRLLASNPEPRNRCMARQVRTRALVKLGRTGSALDEDIQRAIEDCQEQGEVVAVNILRFTLAEKWVQDGKRSQAIALLEASLPEVTEIGYTRLLGEFKALLAVYRHDAGDEAGAEADALFVTRIKGQDPRWAANVKARRVLYEIALSRGDLARALEEYRAYAEADKAMLDDVKAREYAVQQSRHELIEKNQSISELLSRNRVLQLQQEVARRTAWNSRLALALLLVLVASLGYWGWRARRQHGSLKHMAETDGLTGLANRRHFRSRSEAMLAMCAQRQRPACVLLLDLDYFKQINDQCGHSSGDWVLREVARVGKLHCRENDLFGRIGGEEFAMTLVDCDTEVAMRIAEACRRSIETIDPGVISCALPVAVSIGVVATKVSGYDYEVLIANADAAMYRSKVAGRNRVTLYEPPPVPPAGQPVLLERRNAEAMLKQY